MEIRPLQRDDGDAVLELWNRAASHDLLTIGLLEEKTWDDDDFDPDLAIVAVEGGDILGFAVGVLRPEARRGYVKLLAVEPARQREGIGRALVETLETGLTRKGARTIRLLESAPNYLAPGVDTRDAAALAFAAASGYRQVGEARNLSVDLAPRSATRAVPDGVAVRRATRDDSAPLDAFLDAHWPSWAAEVGIALNNQPPTLHIALRDGRAVGFAAWDANNRGTGWFGPMGTAPEARRRGLGQLLLYRCLDDIRESGMAYATIPWVDPVEFYRRCAGAAVERVFHRYEKVLEPCV